MYSRLEGGYLSGYSMLEGGYLILKWILNVGGGIFNVGGCIFNIIVDIPCWWVDF